MDGGTRFRPEARDPATRRIPGGRERGLFDGLPRGQQPSAADVSHKVGGARFPTLIHPQASISPFRGTGGGECHLRLRAVHQFRENGRVLRVEPRRVGRDDTRVGYDVDISPNATVGSNVRIDDAVIGMHSTMIESVELGEGCFVAAGAAVIRDVPPETLVAGVPAAEKKKLR